MVLFSFAHVLICLLLWSSCPFLIYMKNFEELETWEDWDLFVESIMHKGSLNLFDLHLMPSTQL